MELIDFLRIKKVMVKEIPAWGVYLRKRWEDEFANHLSLEEKKSIYLYDTAYACGYLWHLFSYEKKDSLKEEQAEKAFNHAFKKDCYVFYQHSDFAFILENAQMLTADDLVDGMVRSLL